MAKMQEEIIKSKNEQINNEKEYIGIYSVHFQIAAAKV